ncbi:MAG: chaperonin GroEL, partial [Candidatus Caldatribacterium sp.]|nr:chaperonin GroEL [Candidatus Caldatribacterium sp.]
MARTLLFGNQARQALLQGVRTLADAVRITLGPRGRITLLEQSGGLPFATRDGVTIAREVALRNFENIGVRLLQEVAMHTYEAAGDGTTTAVVLAQKMIEEGTKALLSFHNPV